MNAREELADDFTRFLNANYPCPCPAGADCEGERAEADALVRMAETRGYRKPRTITTAEELEALHYGSVVLDAARTTATRLDAFYWQVAGFASNFRVGAVELPATVLYEGDAA